MPWVLLCAAVVATLPLRLFLRADINREPTFEIVIYLYGFRMQFEGLLERDASLSVRRGGGKNGVRRPLRALGRFFLRLLEVSSPARLEATCRLGTGDAFGTALAAAGLHAGLSALGARCGMKLRVYADFRRACFALRARCILSFRGGDIIRAGVLALLEGAPSAKREGHAHGTASH